MSRVETYTGPFGPNEDGEDFTADTFLEFLRRSHSRWYSDGDATKQQWVFRGHWDASWKLVPSAARAGSLGSLARLIEKRFFGCTESAGRLSAVSGSDQRILATIAAYADAMRNFMIMCNEMGENSEMPLKKMRILDDIKEAHVQSWVDAIGYGSNKGLYLGGSGSAFPGMDTPIAALAQHHGVPTFSLDWTWSPWIAAYFSTNEPREISDTHNVCVWALNLHAVDGEQNGAGFHASSAGLGKIGVNAPAKEKNAYLSSQQGVLTFLKNDCGLWRDSGSYPSLDAIVQNWTVKGLEKSIYAQQPEQLDNHRAVIKNFFDEEAPLLRKIVLKKEHLPQLRRLLRRENITKAHLMPTMDNIASTSLRHAVDE